MKAITKFKITLVIFFVFSVLSTFVYALDAIILPTVIVTCDAEMKARATEIINKTIFNEYSTNFNYDEIIKVEKDGEGNIAMLKADTLKMNKIAHVEKLKEVYGRRRDLMLKTMAEAFPEGLDYTHPEGGLFTWVELPSHLDAKVIMKDCLKSNVAYVPGGSFFPNGGKENCFRLNYSTMTDEKIVEGINRLGAVLKQHMQVGVEA